VRDISELRADMEKLFFTLFFSPVSANAGAPGSIFASASARQKQAFAQAPGADSTTSPGPVTPRQKMACEPAQA
jgi:hypothetical protein